MISGQLVKEVIATNIAYVLEKVRMLLELGLVTDPEGVQTRSLAAASKQLGRVL